MTLRLVIDQPDLERTPRPWPALRVIERPGTIAERNRWRWTTSGLLIPLTSKRDRITLAAQHAPKAWLEQRKRLDEATDAIAAALDDDELEAAVLRWRDIAARVLVTKNHHPGALRNKIALAAVIAGARFAYGGLSAEDQQTAQEWVFACLDRAAV